MPANASSLRLAALVAALALPGLGADCGNALTNPDVNKRPGNDLTVNVTASPTAVPSTTGTSRITVSVTDRSLGGSTLSIDFSTTAGTFDGASGGASESLSTRDSDAAVTLRGNGQAVVASVTVTVREDSGGRTGASRTTVRFGNPDL